MTIKTSLVGLAAGLAVCMGGLANAETVGTAGVPTGFGLAGGTMAVSVSGTYGPERNPPTDTTRFDGSGAVMLGFGNPVTGLGVQGGVNVTSFRHFGDSGYLTLGAHKMFQTSEAGIYSVALNVTHLAPWGDAEALDPGASLVGSYLTSFGGKLSVVSLGIATDTNDDRDIEGIFGFGMGISPDVAVSIGQVGKRTALGMSFSPERLAGNSLSVSLNHDHDTDDNTLMVDIGRSFNLFGN